jgi:hypothetical protein
MMKEVKPRLNFYALIYKRLSRFASRAARLFVPAAHAPEMTRRAFRVRINGGGGQATHNLAFLFVEFVPRLHGRGGASRAASLSRFVHQVVVHHIYVRLIV